MITPFWYMFLEPKKKPPKSPGSAPLPTGFQRFRETYGKLDLDEADIGGTGWYTEDPQEVSLLNAGSE